MADLDGTNGDGILFGTDEDDAIRGFAGNDFLSGAGGNNLIPACSEDVGIRFAPVAHATTDCVSFAVRRKPLTADHIGRTGGYLGIAMLRAAPDPGGGSSRCCEFRRLRGWRVHRDGAHDASGRYLGPRQYRPS